MHRCKRRWTRNPLRGQLATHFKSNLRVWVVAEIIIPTLFVPEIEFESGTVIPSTLPDIVSGAASAVKGVKACASSLFARKRNTSPVEFAGRDTQPFVPDLSHITGKTAQNRNRAIQAILNELSNVKFTFVPKYNPFIGQGVAQKGGGIQIGKRNFSSRVDLTRVMIHEELHQRWWARGIIEHHPNKSELKRPLTLLEAQKEAKFYATINRFQRMKGMTFNQEFIDAYYALFNIR